MELHEHLEQVTDRESFFDFVQALTKDRISAARQEAEHPSSAWNAPGGWENWTIEAFLESALAWAKDSNMGQSQGLPEEPSWKAFAVFLYCGKIYE